MKNTQIVTFETEEVKGIFSIEDEKYPTTYSENDCLISYNKMRIQQSIKGFKRAMPLSVKFRNIKTTV